jgi:NOL1/NOP2/fmu family ribosome biogenesis protein
VKELKINIFKGDATEPETSIKIPINPLKAVKALMPDKVRKKMAEKGIDLEEIHKKIVNAEISGKILEIQDKEDHIIISVE